MRTFIASLLTTLACLGCDTPPAEPRTAFGIYDFSAPASCTVSPTGMPDEFFTIRGEVEVLPVPDGYDASCERLLDIRIETCPACTPSPCQVCLSGVSDDDGALSATLVADPTLLGVRPACQLQDSMGEATTRLFVDGRAVMGTSTTTTDGAGMVSLSLTGTTARGISGVNRPSTVSCTIDTTRRPDPMPMP